MGEVADCDEASVSWESFWEVVFCGGGSVLWRR